VLGGKMKLGELLKDKKLPVNVKHITWKPDQFFEVKLRNDKWAIGFFQNGYPYSCTLNDDDFSVYTKPMSDEFESKIKSWDAYGPIYPTGDAAVKILEKYIDKRVKIRIEEIV
jgi:hypothetical protein